MKIFLISPPFRVVQEIETIHYFLSLGIDLHIRKENFTPRDMQGYVNMIDKKFHSRCSIHGSMYCSQIEGIRRFHLKSNENVSDLAHEKGNYYSFSKSLHLLKDYHKEKKTIIIIFF